MYNLANERVRQQSEDISGVKESPWHWYSTVSR